MAKSRFTAKDLENEIKLINSFLLESGSLYHYVIGSAYGHTQVNMCYFTSEGVSRCLCNVEIGTPRQCDQKMTTDHYNYLGKNYPEKITRKAAKAFLSMFIDFKKDNVQLAHSDLLLLAKWAKLTKYRKPSGASYSLGSAFYLHLQKKVKIN